jgi:large-conductance mechanosensitive channel
MVDIYPERSLKREIAIASECFSIFLRAIGKIKKRSLIFGDFLKAIVKFLVIAKCDLVYISF